jgi:hypothetical protein
MSLSTFITDTLGSFYDYLDWDSDNTDFVIQETLEQYGVDTEAEATDEVKLHALARVEIWKRVLVEVGHNYNFSADGGTYNRSQVFDMVTKNYELALKKALPYQSEYGIDTGELTTEQDPYNSIYWYERDL